MVTFDTKSTMRQFYLRRLAEMAPLAILRVCPLLALATVRLVCVVEELLRFVETAGDFLAQFNQQFPLLPEGGFNPHLDPFDFRGLWPSQCHGRVERAIYWRTVERISPHSFFYSCHVRHRFRGALSWFPALSVCTLETFFVSFTCRVRLGEFGSLYRGSSGQLPCAFHISYVVFAGSFDRLEKMDLFLPAFGCTQHCATSTLRPLAGKGIDVTGQPPWDNFV